MFIFPFFIYIIFVQVQPHKYYIDRDSTNSEDHIHLKLDGIPGMKCEVKLLEKNDLFYYYDHPGGNKAKPELIPCNEKHEILTGTALPTYYVQVKSKTGIENLKLVHYANKIPQVAIKVNATAIEFKTRHICSHPQKCSLVSENKIIDNFIPKKETECNVEAKITGLLDSIKDSAELSCGINQPKLYLFQQNNDIDVDPLKKYPYHIEQVTGGSNKIKIIFDESLNDEICKFEIKKKGEGNYETKCSVQSNGECHQFCTDVTMDLEFNSGDKDFSVKISTRNFEGTEKILRIGKSNLVVKPTSTSVILPIDTLKDDLKSENCKIELKKQKNPDIVIDTKCDEALKTSCPTTCTASTIFGLEPNTKYIVKVTYSGASNTEFVSEKLFKTANFEMTQKPEISAYYEHVVMTIAPKVPLFEGVYCQIKQKMKGEIEFTPSECEESASCSGLCSEPQTIRNLLPGTEYQFKYLFDKYISDLSTNTVRVSTKSELKKLTVTNTWNDKDLTVKTSIEPLDEEYICDFTFAEMLNGSIKNIYVVYDQSTEWKGKCNNEITFFNAELYKKGSMKVQARYLSEPVIISLSKTIQDETNKLLNPDLADNNVSDGASVGGSKVILIVGGVLIALLVCAVGIMFFRKK